MLHFRSTATAGLDFVGSVSNHVLAWTLPEHAFVDDLMMAACLDSGVRMLDVGCGNGHLLWRAGEHEPGAVLVGVDLDPDAIEVARKRTKDSPNRIEFHKTDGRSLPFSDDYFDVVTMTLVLRTVPWRIRQQMLRESLRVLSPGGRLLVADWSSRGCVIARMVSDIARAVPGGELWRPTKLSAIGRDVSEAGFEPPQQLGEYCTVTGAIDLVAAHKPLGA